MSGVRWRRRRAEKEPFLWVDSEGRPNNTQVEALELMPKSRVSRLSWRCQSICGTILSFFSISFDSHPVTVVYVEMPLTVRDLCLGLERTSKQKDIIEGKESFFSIASYRCRVKYEEETIERNFSYSQVESSALFYDGIVNCACAWFMFSHQFKLIDIPKSVYSIFSPHSRLVMSSGRRCCRWVEFILRSIQLDNETSSEKENENCLWKIKSMNLIYRKRR